MVGRGHFEARGSATEDPGCGRAAVIGVKAFVLPEVAIVVLAGFGVRVGLCMVAIGAYPVAIRVPGVGRTIAATLAQREVHDQGSNPTPVAALFRKRVPMVTASVGEVGCDHCGKLIRRRPRLSPERRAMGSSFSLTRIPSVSNNPPSVLHFANQARSGTGTKDPAKPDTYYVEALLAPDTVNTMPQPTLDAFVDHGHVGDMLPEDARGADEVIAQMEALGIDVADLAGRLQ